MSRHLLYLAVLLVLSACDSPTSPGSIQSHLEITTPNLKVNGVTIQPESTTNTGVGASIDLRVDYTNNSGQSLHIAFLLVRDDGVEHLLSCGVTGSGGQGGGFGVGTTIFAEDRGHTVRVLLLGAYGPNSSGPGQQCLLQSSPGQVNHANVQAQRLLMTLVVQ
jgi:hypothetical protein